MAYQHIHNHRNWWNSLFFYMNQIRKLGFNYFVGSLVLCGDNQKPNETFIKKIKDRWGVEIIYEDELVNGKRLKKIIAKPQATTATVQDNLTLLFPGHGISINRDSLIENVVEHVVTGNRVVIAYDQSGVGQSCNYKHPSEYTLREDVAAQAKSCYATMEKYKKSGSLHPEAKMDIYGLCFGGVLASVAADAIKDKPDFSCATISRAPFGIWDMAALCPDYKRFFPSLNMDRRHTQANTKKPTKKENILIRALKSIVYSLVCTFIKILNLMTYLPNIIRRILIYPIFALVGWRLDVTKELRVLDKSKKVTYLSLNACKKGSDEFVNSAADMAAIVKNPIPLFRIDPKMRSKYFDYLHENKYLYSLLKNKEFADFYRHLAHPEQGNGYKHQAWSATLFAKDKDNHGVIYNELTRAASSPDRKSRSQTKALAV
ncbi:MAG: hypothetical protein VX112_04270 [Pseudomonadota bacterium]|nr:hypothetical protein [Pseudomonadota bacterium]